MNVNNYSTPISEPMDILIPHPHYAIVKSHRTLVFFDKESKLPLKAMGENDYVQFKYDKQGNLSGLIIMERIGGELEWSKMGIRFEEIREYADSQGNWYDYRKFTEGMPNSIDWVSLSNVVFRIMIKTFKTDNRKPSKTRYELRESLSMACKNISQRYFQNENSHYAV